MTQIEAITLLCRAVQLVYTVRDCPTSYELCRKAFKQYKQGILEYVCDVEVMSEFTFSDRVLIKEFFGLDSEEIALAC